MELGGIGKVSRIKVLFDTEELDTMAIERV